MSRQYRASVVVIALAAISFLAYRHYHHGNRFVSYGPVTILVAKRAIPKGTPLHILAAKELYLAKTVRPSEIFRDAITDPDPAALRGMVTVKRISAGQQLTAADFGPSTH